MSERGRAERAGIHLSAWVCQTAPVKRRDRVVWVLALALLAGCRSGIRATVQERSDLKLSAVAVYPFGFRWDEPAYRSFELSQRLIGTLSQELEGQVLLFGPSEFKVFRPDADNAWAATNVVSLFPSHGVRAEAAAVLRAWAERRVTSAQKELYDARGRAVGAQGTEETVYVGHVELLHPSSSSTLIEMHAEVVVDPFAERPDDGADPIPELTALMEHLVAEAAAALAPMVHPLAEPRRWEVEWAFNPKAAFTYSEEGRPSMEVRLVSMDPVDAELLTQGRIRFANPALPDAEAARLSRLPGGLYVLAASNGVPLSPGDLVTAVEGQPALPQVLDRARFTQTPVALKVRRPTGELVEVTLP